MNIPKIMVFFHLSFLLLSLVAASLMITDIIALDWSALWVIAIAGLFNALFLFLWIRQLGQRSTQEPSEPQPPAITSRIFAMVSLVVPVYNEEANLASHIDRLIKCSYDYRGPSEIIIVDDGSTDNTFEVALSTIDSNQTEFQNVHTAVLRHTARLGRTEAIKSGVNKAMGEYIAIIDTAVSCDSISLNKLADSTYTANEADVKLSLHPETEDIATVPSTIRLYRASALRHLVNEELPKRRTAN